MVNEKWGYTIFDYLYEILGIPDLEDKSMHIWRNESFHFCVALKPSGFVVDFKIDGSAMSQVEMHKYEDVIKFAKLFASKTNPKPEQETPEPTETEYDHEPDAPMVIKE